ncbi:Thrombospondin-type laminin G domain and EAR repeat-containing protein, partial [Camelus dromedarius]
KKEYLLTVMAEGMADGALPATLSVQGAQFFIGSGRRTKGLFTERQTILPSEGSTVAVLNTRLDGAIDDRKNQAMKVTLGPRPPCTEAGGASFGLTRAARAWTVVQDEWVSVVSRSRQARGRDNHNIDSVIYKWNRDPPVEANQTIATRAPRLGFFTVGPYAFLAVAKPSTARPQRLQSRCTCGWPAASALQSSWWEAVPPWALHRPGARAVAGRRLAPQTGRFSTSERGSFSLSRTDQIRRGNAKCKTGSYVINSDSRAVSTINFPTEKDTGAWTGSSSRWEEDYFLVVANSSMELPFGKQYYLQMRVARMLAGDAVCRH